MVRLRFETDLANSLKATADLAAATEKVGAGYSRATAEAKKLEQAAARIVKENETPQERYNRKIDQLGKSLRAGAVGFDDAHRAAARLRQKLEEAGQSSERSFGASAVDRMASYAIGLFGIQQVVAGISGAFREVETRAKAAGDAIFGSLGAFGELQQVATSQEDYNKLVASARGMVGPIFAKGQEGQAADLVFALRNAGYSDADIGFITQIGAATQIRPEGMQQFAEGLQKYQSTFGRAQAGGIPQVGRKVFQAAGAMQATVSATAAAATLFGTEAGVAGATDEEALAAFVAIERQSPGVEEAATRLRGIFNQIIQKKLKRGTFQQTMTQLVGRVRAGEAPIDILGETRAAAGLGIFAGAEGQAVYGEQLKAISAAETTDIIAQRQFLGGDPLLEAARQRKLAEGQAAVSIQARRGVAANRVAAIMARREERITEQGFGMELFAGFMDTLFGWYDRPVQLEMMQKRVEQEERDRENLELMRKQTAVIEQDKALTPPKPHGRAEP